MRLRHGSGIVTQNLTVQAIVDVTMAAFTDFHTNMECATASSISSALERFLLQQLSYDDLARTVGSLVGVTQPLEKLRAILETGSDPIPPPADDIQTTGGRRPSRAWTQYEDQRLLAGIYRNGIENWTSISKFVGNGRTRSQCTQRWYRGLDPKISKDHWSKDEEHKLLALVEEHSDKCWTTIAAKLGHRSDVQCRYRYRQLQKDVHGRKLRPPPMSGTISSSPASTRPDFLRPTRRPVPVNARHIAAHHSMPDATGARRRAPGRTEDSIPHPARQAAQPGRINSRDPIPRRSPIPRPARLPARPVPHLRPGTEAAAPRSAGASRAREAEESRNHRPRIGREAVLGLLNRSLSLARGKRMCS
jgi:hypothetical protein